MFYYSGFRPKKQPLFSLLLLFTHSFLKIANLEGQNITGVVAKLDEMSEKFGVDFVLSVSRNESELDDSLKSKIIVSI